MNTKIRYSLLALIALAILVLGVSALAVTSAKAATAYYVDCSAGSNGSGTQASPWNTLTSVNGHTFVAGDSILFKRGTTCSGVLWPLGSGSSGSPITIADYGTGALPIINGGSNEEAIKLYNQEYWAINNIETTGGTRYGIYINGSGASVLHYFHITNSAVHNVTGGTMDKKTTGLIVFGYDFNQQFDDILIDNVTAHDTTLWAGIITSGKGWGHQSTRSNNVTIRNTTVYNVYGDGIVIFSATNGLIENSVAYEIGNQPGAQTIGTPNGIWTWDCATCTVQTSEAYLTSSPGVDGGGFDIDYYNDNNTYQYNYAHDNDSYCIAVFGAESTATTNSIIRYNICSYNGRDVTEAVKGDVELFTWTSGSIDGVQIYNNTFYWSPAAAGPAFNDVGSTYSGSRTDFFKNNIIYSTVAQMINVPSRWSLDYNLYWYTGGTPSWKYNGTNYTSFSTYKTGSGQDAHSLNTDPLLNSPTYHGNGKPTTQFTLQSGSPAINAGTNVGSMGSRDFFGNTIPYSGGAYDIGAHEYQGAGAPTATPTNTPVGPTPTPTRTPTPTNTPVLTNLLTNPGFETGSASPWWTSNTTIVKNNPHSGSYSARINNSSAGVAMIGVTVSPSTNYRFTGWCKLANTSQKGYIYAKNFGGTTVTASITTTAYAQYTADFTTGSSNTTVEVGAWRDASSGTTYVYCDDFSLTTR